MPSNLYKRGGIWYCRVQVQGHDHRRSLRTRSRVQAVKALRKVLAEVENYRFTGQERHGWKDAVTEWLAHGAADLRPATLRRYLVSLGQVRPYLDDLRLDEITRATIARIARRPGITNATRRRDLTAVSNVLRFAAAQGWIETNPARDWDRGVIAERREPIALPDEADIDFVVSLASGNFARLVRFAQYTGMRQGEIVSLERRQVRGRRVDLWRTKTRRPRVVPLDDRGVGTITGTPPYLGSDVMFWHDQGDAYSRAANQFSALVRRAVRAAKKRGRRLRPFRFHDLRHWFAVDYLRRGGNIYALQKILGHSSISTTEIYLDHLDPAEQHSAKYGVGTKSAQDGDAK